MIKAVQLCECPKKFLNCTPLKGQLFVYIFTFLIFLFDFFLKYS